MEPIVEQVTTNYLELGEGPHWDEESQTLYYVGIFDNTVLRYNPATGKETKAKFTSDAVGFIVPVAGKKHHFVIGHGMKFDLIKWDGESDNVEVVETLGRASAGNRINDGKADPNGRIFGGTMGREDPPGVVEPNVSALYTLDQNGAKAVAKNIGLSNGLAWNLQKGLMYYIDSLAKAVYSYDYNSSTGDIKNRKVVVDFEKSGIEGLPDGMTIDTDGNLWVACFFGYQVVKIDPNNGKVLQTVKIPASQVTSVAFGGKNLDELYVTTASMKISEVQNPPCGALFVIKNLGVRGYPGTPCRL